MEDSIGLVEWALREHEGSFEDHRRLDVAWKEVIAAARLGHDLREVHALWQSGEYHHTQVYFADEVERIIAKNK